VKIPAATALEILKDRECVVRDFTAEDMASYDKIADFLVSHKITPVKLDVGKVVQKGFYSGK
jgi:NitT/TauT family transport system substrate-binding protein